MISLTSQPSPLDSIWSSLELVRSQSAVPAVWQRHLGEHFEAFKRAFLLPRSEPARYFPCAKCGCAHEIHEGRGSGVEREPGGLAGGLRHSTPDARPSVVAVCSCEPWNCPDLTLTPADIQILELSWAKLARALCHTLALNARLTELRIHNTIQVGSWSADAVPVIFTIQSDRPAFRAVLCELITRLRGRFILLTPTNDHLDATSRELLAKSDSALFALSNHVLLTPEATLRLRNTSPGELFARFTPQPKESDEGAARRAFELVRQLEATSKMKPPSALTVFRLYCMEELTTTQIARTCRCGKTTVIHRLNLIRDKTGVDPESLRRLSDHFNRMEDDLTDSRAQHIHRKKLIYDEEEEG
jgi:hypothetical protein